MTIEYATANEALLRLSKRIMERGAEVPSRVGNTRELTFERFTITDPCKRELTLPIRKASIAAQIAETMWVLSGRNDVGWLSHYLPRAVDFSDEGKVWRAGYGPRIRNWDPVSPVGGTDQMAEVIKKLRSDPNTRQAVISLWDPAADWVETKDVPCNNWLHFLHRDGRLHLHVAIRSNDLWWGWSGINQFEWSVLLEVVASYAGMEVGSIHYAVSSLHLYERHWDKAEELPEGYAVVTAAATPLFWNGVPQSGTLDWDELCEQWFAAEDVIRNNPHSQAARDDVNAFPEPMLGAWLRVLLWWWGGNNADLQADGVYGTRLEAAARIGMQPPNRVPEPTPPSQFIEHVIELHNAKHAAYGDSWKRRGEKLGIMANIARKVDRLGGGETPDETQLDTAIDLMVYLAKYQSWQADNVPRVRAYQGSDKPDEANRIMAALEGPDQPGASSTDIVYLKDWFEELWRLVETEGPRHVLVADMLRVAYAHARELWDAVKAPAEPAEPEPPHSRACGVFVHPHGAACHSNCPTCHGNLNETQRRAIRSGTGYKGADSD